MPSLHAADESFFRSAPQIITRTFAIPRPAAEVWDGVTGDRPLEWCRGLSATWTSPRPLGVGATRDAKVLGLMKVQEHFFVWEDGRRCSFYVTSANLPVFRRLAEDFLVEADGPDACRFTWTAAIEPSALGKAGGPLNPVLFGRFFADTAKHFDATVV